MERHAVPEIAKNGYELCSVSQFLERAPAAHVKRYQTINKGPFIIWDPNDDEDGFMLAGATIAELNAGFLEHFEGFLE